MEERIREEKEGLGRVEVEGGEHIQKEREENANGRSKACYVLHTGCAMVSCLSSTPRKEKHVMALWDDGRGVYLRVLKP